MSYSVQEQFALRQAALIAFAASFGVRADAGDPVVAGYRARQDDLVAKSQAIIAQADTEKRELNADERKLITDNTAEVERLENEIDLRERVSAQDRRLGEPTQRKLPANSNSAPSDSGRGVLQTTNLNSPATRAAAMGNGGWRSFGDFAAGVRAAAVNASNVDQRLRAAQTTYGSEGVGSDGGFAVPPDYRAAIMSLVQAEDSLFARVDSQPTSSNSVTVPTDEATVWGTSGVRVYTRAEAQSMTVSKPAMKDVTVRLNELYALVPVTDELLDDAPLLGSFLTTKAGDALTFAITNYIINGTGVGQPLGILVAPSLVSVAAEASQTAGTIHALNVAKMWARMPARNRGSAVWLANQDAEAQLMQLGFQIGKADGSAFTGGVPLFVPPGGLSAAPYATLMGRPVITTEACPTLGTVGDLIFAYLPGYFMPYKAGGVKSDVSIHLYFDQALTTFRWSFRIGGQPWLSAAIARKNGSNTLSHFVTIAAR